MYNAQNFISQCLDSILSQDFDDYEVIVVDDGSSDNSSTIVERYISKFSQIKLIHTTNRGVSAARNLAIKNSKGDWLCFVDADDMLYPNTLAVLYSSVCSTDVDIVFGNVDKYVNEKMIPLFSFSEGYSQNPIKSLKNLALWGYLFKKSIIFNNNIKFKEGLAYSEDALFIYQYSLSCRNILFIPNKVYIYRIHDASACRSHDYLHKVKNQFYASQLLYKLANDNKSNPSAYKRINSDSFAKIRMGIYNYIIASNNFKDFTEIQRLFNLYCGNYASKLFFYYNICVLYVQCQRRKIIRFRNEDNTFLLLSYFKRR